MEVTLRPNSLPGRLAIRGLAAGVCIVEQRHPSANRARSASDLSLESMHSSPKPPARRRHEPRRACKAGNRGAGKMGGDQTERAISREGLTARNNHGIVGFVAAFAS